MVFEGLAAVASVGASVFDHEVLEIQVDIDDVEHQEVVVEVLKVKAESEYLLNVVAVIQVVVVDFQVSSAAGYPHECFQEDLACWDALAYLAFLLFVETYVVYRPFVLT